MTDYLKTYLGVRDIMRLFNCSHPTAKRILEDARRIQNSNYKSLEKRVLLEKVLKVMDITDKKLWLSQQKERFQTYETH